MDLSRKRTLINKLVIIDGQPGCGKTMLSPIISSFKRVELITYVFEIEFISRLYKFKKISKDAALSMIKLLSDQKVYQTMMGRDLNFRIGDMSSIFNYHNPNIYLKRIYEKGDEAVPNKIKKNKPILNFTTHDMLYYSDILFESLNNKLLFIEVVRHPLYMLIQQTLNMEKLIDNPRDIQLNYKYNDQDLPYFVRGWEADFLSSNDIDRAIYTIFNLTKKNSMKRKKIKDKKNYLLIPFENFVLYPNKYLDKILKKLSTSFSNNTKKVLKEQKIPRKKIADSISLDIYKRCGWKPPKTGINEIDELSLRRDFALKNKASNKAMIILDKLSKDYEREYLQNIL